MFHRLRHLIEWQRLRETLKMVARSSSCRMGAIELCYPPGSWYEERAGEMLQVLADTAAKLEQTLGVPLPKTCCYVVEPETAVAIQGTVGAAYEQMVILGIPERHLSDLAGIGAHELAHIASHRLGRSDPPFKGEGFACYAAALIGAHQMPMGIPLHYHLVWLLSVGVKAPLAELWERRDYTPELYDLAWSFASFVAERFGQKEYFAFYGSAVRSLRDRAEATLGLPLAKLEKEWHETARSRVPGDPSRISRMHRCAGCVCSRAAWLGKRGAPVGVP